MHVFFGEQLQLLRKWPPGSREEEGQLDRSTPVRMELQAYTKAAGSGEGFHSPESWCASPRENSSIRPPVCPGLMMNQVSYSSGLVLALCSSLALLMRESLTLTSSRGCAVPGPTFRKVRCLVSSAVTVSTSPILFEHLFVLRWTLNHQVSSSIFQAYPHACLLVCH